MISYRQTIPADIPSLLAIRVATWHHEGGAAELEARGINESSVLNRLRTDHAGWIALDGDRAIGFAMANRSSGELWVIAVLPEYEGRGIGRQLMRQAEAWLFSHGWEDIWLTTFVDETYRAVGFYRHLGWIDEKMEGARFLKKANPGERYQLEEHVVECPDTGYSRLVRLQRGPEDQPHRLSLFLDGEHYWRDMSFIPLLDSMRDCGEIPAMTIATVGHVSALDRHLDYAGNEAYLRFIGQRLVPWLVGEVDGLKSGGHLIAGLSLSGLAAVNLAIRFPHLFRSCLSQSGSHWWETEGFEREVESLESVEGRFWFSVGDEETEVEVRHPPTGLHQGISQIEGVERAAAVVRDGGGTVRVNQFQGGHSLVAWKDELPAAIAWLIGE